MYKSLPLLVNIAFDYAIIVFMLLHYLIQHEVECVLMVSLGHIHECISAF